MAEKPHVGVLFGGRSGEHPISIRSSRYVVDSLDRDRFELVLIGIDRAGGWHLCAEARVLAPSTQEVTRRQPAAPWSPSRAPAAAGCSIRRSRSTRCPDSTSSFPILHGPYGEDGTIQGLLDMLDVAYVGRRRARAPPSAWTRMSASGCCAMPASPIVPFEVVTALRVVARARLPSAQPPARSGYPLFVKPASLGSSLGVSKVREDARRARRGHRACARAGHEDPDRARHRRARDRVRGARQRRRRRLRSPGEIVPGEAFYSFDDKYAADSQARLLIPAPLPDDVRAKRARARGARLRASSSAPAWRASTSSSSTATGTALHQRAEHHPRLHLDQHVSEAVGGVGLSGTALVTRLIELALERHAARQRSGSAHARA